MVPVVDIGFSCFFFFNDTATTEIYTLSLHDALPICSGVEHHTRRPGDACSRTQAPPAAREQRSEEHTSELLSHHDLVCRLLLEKKKTKPKRTADAGSVLRLRSHPGRSL